VLSAPPHFAYDEGRGARRAAREKTRVLFHPPAGRTAGMNKHRFRPPFRIPLPGNQATAALTLLTAALCCRATGGEWLNVTHEVGGDKWGYAGVCLLAAVPDSAAVIAGVSEAGLWRTDDLGKTWRKLAPDGQEQIRHRPHQIVFDPADPRHFWVSGCYGPSPFLTADGGQTFQRLGNLTHMDGLGVAFTDPERKTLVVGLHEQARSVHKSTDGGKSWQKIGDGLPEDSNHSTDPIVIDAKTFIINTAGWAQKKTWGIYRTEDGGTTWAKVSEVGCASRALTTPDGTIYWAICYGNGIVKSADQGKTWQKLTGPARFGPIQLGPGKIAALGGQQVYVSTDAGQTWEKLADPLPFKPNGISYNGQSRSIYAWRSTEKKADDAILRWDLPQ
jgi:photosystem II stability/assembly factor-like uncharacterized protein